MLNCFWNVITIPWGSRHKLCEKHVAFCTRFCIWMLLCLKLPSNGKAQEKEEGTQLTTWCLCQINFRTQLLIQRDFLQTASSSVSLISVPGAIWCFWHCWPASSCLLPSVLCCMLQLNPASLFRWFRRCWWRRKCIWNYNCLTSPCGFQPDAYISERYKGGGIHCHSFGLLSC